MFKKDFQSLNRNRRRPTSNGFKTVNSLQDNAISKSSPLSSPKNLVEDQVQNSRKIRRELVSLDKNSSRDEAVENGQALMTRDVLNKLVSVGLHKLDEPPISHLIIKSMDYNGARYQKNGTKDLMINISVDGSFIFFTLGPKIVKGLVINLAKHVKSITFSMLNRSLLIELVEQAGYVYITYIASTWDFVDQLRSVYKKVGGEEHSGTNEELLSKIRQIDSERTPKSKTNGELLFSSNSSTPTRKITPIDPNKMYGSRTTRSVTRLTGGLDPHSSPSYKVDGSDSDSESADYIKPLKEETPEPFDPPLTYKFLDSKKFTINNSDFKTLYNNDWINDSVIDFFIKYDIDQAVKNKLFKQDEIFAFNSFFFNKLMTKNKETSPAKEADDIVSLDKDTLPNYYGNIKRWLTKIDLMKYPYVIIPINENLHWYCCVVRGLPELLARAMKLKEEMKAMDGFQFNNDDVVVKDTFRVEIFIFDSLSQKHSHIHYPLKKFIIDYCKDKYDLEITKDQFRAVNARVPKQNNFNDCGIHVIYNVRKLLSNSTECERLWKSGNSLSRYQSKLFFKASERNGMRQTLRETLKRLQKEENTVNESNGKLEEEEQEEDIEIIEVESAKAPLREQDAAKREQAHDTDVLEKVIAILDNIDEKRTLDPKKTSFLLSIVSNKFIRRQLSGKKLNKVVVEILNQIYPGDNEINAEELARVAEFAARVGALDLILETERISEELLQFLKELMQKSSSFDQLSATSSAKITPTKTAKATTLSTAENSRPVDEKLVIQHYLDSEDLNQSVNDLQISEGDERPQPSSSPIKKRTTPEASSPLNKDYKSFPNKRRKLID